MDSSLKLKVFFHREQKVVGLFFPANDLPTSVVKKMEGIKWSQTHKCWYMPFRKDMVELMEKYIPVPQIEKNKLLLHVEESKLNDLHSIKLQKFANWLKLQKLQT